MSIQQVIDMIVPVDTAMYISLGIVEKSLYSRAGIMQVTPDAQDQINGRGKLFPMPYWGDLQGDPDVPNDSAAGVDDAVADGADVGEDQARRNMRTKTWGANYLAAAFSGEDPIAVFEQKQIEYWTNQMQIIMNASTEGVFADNLANDGGDMVNKINSTALTTDPTAANKISGDAVLDTLVTAGDRGDEYAGFGVHSLVANELRKQNTIVTNVPQSDTKVVIEKFMNMDMIVDDVTNKGTEGTNAAGDPLAYFDTVFYGYGAIQFAEKNLGGMALEFDRQPLAGKGSGETTVTARHEFVMHPTGIKWTDASVAGKFPTLAELKDAANWDREYARKQVKLAMLRCNA